MSYELPNKDAREEAIKTRQAIILKISRQLESSEHNKVAGAESMGGNAGDQKLAVNAYVDNATGEIVAFGNFQELEKSIVNNKNYGEVTFIEQVPNFTELMTAVSNKENPQEIKRKYSFKITRVIFYGQNISREAKENIEGAVDVLRRVRERDFKEEEDSTV